MSKALVPTRNTNYLGAKTIVLGFKSSTNIVKNKYQMKTQYDYPTHTHEKIHTKCVSVTLLCIQGCVPSPLCLTLNNFSNHLEPLHIVELQIVGLQIAQIVHAGIF